MPWPAPDEDADEGGPLPDRIGPYRVLSEIGRGGMGRVYLAVQEGEGFTRRVALKVVAPEGSGSEIQHRFREERRILAALDHPGIARFLDAGRDADGRWYLALEYIEGASLVDYARAWQLTIEQRLRLFRAILEAVAFAHAHGVVHRDLKPANILVGSDGRPRLLDFGIAKLLDAESVSTVTRTHPSLRALTPAYASPEQFRGDAITPASDVFSLGVLLYELLVGVRPFGHERTSRVALEREILDEDPEPPGEVARSRAVSPGDPSESPASGGRLSRDLDAICLKALRKLPGDRYGSAQELADDLDRHLGGLPVAARGADRRYRAGRFLARNRSAVAVVAAVAVAAGALAVSLLRTPVPATRREPAPRPFAFSGITAADVPALEADFTAAPADVPIGARLALALDAAARNDEALLVVERLRQIPGHAEDPLIDYVEASLASSADRKQRALVLFGVALDRALEQERGDLAAQIRASRGRLLFVLGRRDEALADMESARSSFEAVRDAASLARVLNDLAIARLVEGRIREGERLLELALAASREAGSGSPGVIVTNLAQIAVQRGFPDRAEPLFRDVLATYLASGSRRLAQAKIGLANALFELDRRDEAVREIADALDLLQRTPVERSRAYALRLRGNDELVQGELATAAATAEELAETARSSADRLALGISNRLRGEIAAARGDLPDARKRFDEARLQLFESDERDELMDLHVAWAEIELAAGDRTAARAHATIVRPKAEQEIEVTSQFLAESVLVRLAARSGESEESTQRLARLESRATGTTARSWRHALEQAVAEIANPGSARDASP